MSRIATFAVGAVTSVALVAGSLTAAQAAPLPAQTAVKVAGENTSVDHVRYRGYGTAMATVIAVATAAAPPAPWRPVPPSA